MPCSSRYSVASTRSSADLSPPRAALNHWVISAVSFMGPRGPSARAGDNIAALEPVGVKTAGPGSTLAAGAPGGSAIAHPAVADAAAADPAAFALAAVDEQFLLEIARCAVGAEEVAQGGAAAGDGVGQDLLHRRREPRVPRAADRSRRAARGDARQEQAFGGVDVAHADHHRLVHQEGLHRRLAAAAAFVQVVAVEG